MTTETLPAPSPATNATVPPSRRRRWWSAPLRTLLVLLFLALAVGGLVPQFAASETGMRTFDGPVRELVVTKDAGRVEVTVGGDTTSVTTTRTEPAWSTATASESLRDGTLAVDSDCVGLWGCLVAHRIEVPAGTRITVEGRAGRVTVVGADAPVDIETRAGDVMVERATSDRVTTRTTAGDVTVSLDAIPTTVEAHTTAGDVTIAVPEASYRLDTDTTSGDVSTGVRRDDDAPRSIVTGTTAGDVVIRTR